MKKVIKYLAIALAIILTVAITCASLGLIGLFCGFFEENAVTEDIKTYSVSGEIRDLDIEINAADVCIKVGDAFLVESNLKYLKVDNRDGCLTVKDTEKKIFGGFSYENAVLTIYLPAEIVFDSINLTTGAGRLTVESLSAETLDLNFGAGEATVSSLVATRSIKIEGGAGHITVSGGALKNLDLDMGVGELDLTSELSGECDLNMGIGEANITLLGNKDNYELDLERGIGSVTVDGKDVTDFGSSGNGTCKVTVSGGIGAINVRFEN